MFFQDAPQTPNLLTSDEALQNEIALRLPKAIIEKWQGAFDDLGKASADVLPHLSLAAENQKPEHVPYGPFGRRIDLIKTSDAWKELKAFSAKHRIISSGYDVSLGEHSRLVEAVLVYLFFGSSATYGCPLAMTDAAAKVLSKDAPASLRDRLLPKLLSDDPESFITSGQWMTERPGGSDVGRSETLARPLDMKGDQERYTLHGVKWFTSATTSEMALALARIDDGENEPVAGSRGLTLFCVEINRNDEGALEGIVVNRLKDKLGTRALPTAELTLEGVVGVRIGEIGRGVATVSAMLNITRWLNALASASNMARGLARAKDYASKRKAFGKLLIEHPLHKRTLDQLEAITAGAMAFTFEIAEFFGKSEAGTLSDEKERVLRALIPLAKLTLGKQAVAVASETLECFGGAGYIEDTGLTHGFREAQVFPIWEGTTNVLSLDLLRAESRGGALSALLKHLGERLAALGSNEALEVVKGKHLALVSLVGALAQRQDVVEMETRARDIALTCGELVEALLLAERAEKDLDGAKERFENLVDALFKPRV